MTEQTHAVLVERHTLAGRRHLLEQGVPVEHHEVVLAVGGVLLHEGVLRRVIAGKIVQVPIRLSLRPGFTGRTHRVGTGVAMRAESFPEFARQLVHLAFQFVDAAHLLGDQHIAYIAT